MKLFKKAEAVKLISIVIISLICCWALGTTKLTAQKIEDVESLAPFVPTHMDVVEKMLKLAEVKKTDVVYDLGVEMEESLLQQQKNMVPEELE